VGRRLNRDMAFNYNNSRTRLINVLLIGVAVLISGCGGASLRPLNQGDVIVAFGDSLTAGKGVDIEHAYPAVLSELIGFDVINAGISGETTEEGLLRLESVLEKENPALLILFEGGNDILRDYDLLETKQNLSDMILLAKGMGIQVALVGLPRKKLFSNTAQLYLELAKTHQLPLEDAIVASLLRKPAMKSDSVHFNQKGYRALAESIASMLKDAGALRENDCECCSI